ncbi:response regulator [Rhodoplanes azumiensis]|uniref:Response regulator n=1 Tax=Rhodoplanes azumiensis TaxID=1897628 RepID=A0ABW5AFB9_9BRAD
MAHILVVDDDELLRVVLGRALEEAGHTVSAAASGRAALVSLEAARYDLVICDVFMPEMDGFETLRAVKERAPDLPVVAISAERRSWPGVPSPDFLEMAVALGATAGLRKPLDLKALKALVARCLRSGETTAPDPPEAS